MPQRDIWVEEARLKSQSAAIWFWAGATSWWIETQEPRTSVRPNPVQHVLLLQGCKFSGFKLKVCLLRLCSLLRMRGISEQLLALACNELFPRPRLGICSIYKNVKTFKKLFFLQKRQTAIVWNCLHALCLTFTTTGFIYSVSVNIILSQEDGVTAETDNAAVPHLTCVICLWASGKRVDVFVGGGVVTSRRSTIMF